MKKELIEQQQIVQNSKKQIERLMALPKKDNNSEILVNNLQDEIIQKSNIIESLNKKLSKNIGDLNKEKDKRNILEQEIEKLEAIMNSKDNESLKFSRKLEELTERKNKLQKECGNLRDENKALSQANSNLEDQKNEIMEKFIKIQDESRDNVDKLRNALKKNNILLKKIAVGIYLSIGFREGK